MELSRLTQDEQRRVLVRLCERAVEVWTAFVRREGEIRYIDSVVGMCHTVDVTLPALALVAAVDGENRFDLERRYMEPITALQDCDLELPDHAEFAYYAVYNLFRKYALGASIDAWLIANQALSSLDESERGPAFSAALDETVYGERK